MANQAITSGSTSLGASGLNSLLTFFLASFRAIKRNAGRPLNYVNTDASALVSSEGQTVTVPLYPTAASSLLTDGSAVTQDDSVGSSVSVTLNKHRVTKFSLTEIASALDGNKVNGGLMEGRIAGLLNDVETDVLSLATAGFTTNVVGSYNTAMTEANIIAAQAAYQAQLPPDNEIPVMLVRPEANAWGALLSLAAFRDYQVTGITSPTVGQGYMANGGTRYGFQWIPTQALPKSGTSIDNLGFNRNAICVAMRSLPTPMSPGVQAINSAVDGVSFQILLNWNSDRLADEMTIHTLYGYSVGKEQWGVQFKS